MSKRITVAIAGNPNSGKTTLFNNITGARQHVGNYPGVTVEKKEGSHTFEGVQMKFVDLPGTYSLTAYSIEEIVARNFVVDEKPDVVVDIVDASNLERNLYLLSQFVELGAPLVVALNMMDVAETRGIRIDDKQLAALLGCPVVCTVGTRGEGTDALLRAIKQEAERGEHVNPERLHYGREIEDEIEKTQALLEQEPAIVSQRPSRWLALKLLETDADVRDLVRTEAERPDVILDSVDKSIAHLERILGEDTESAITDQRYGFARGLCAAAVTEEGDDRLTRSDKIDQIVCNRVIGLPLFAIAMYIVFELVFALGAPPMEWIAAFFGWAGSAIASCWPPGSESALKSLLVDGIIGGVGGVIVFLPNILLLFVAIAFLEDSGYMARAAFIVDKFMHKLGLHGKSFIPMLIGFGCSVPGIMATRTLDNRRDRLTTLLVLPLISCGARLPIYALIIPAFFPAAWRGRVLFILYATGIAFAGLCARLLRSTLFRGEAVPFVMELPPYRMPTLRGTVIHMWERSWLYLKKAGTIILSVSVLLWALTSYPKTHDADAGYEQAIAQAQADLMRVSWRVNAGDLSNPPALAEQLRLGAQAGAAGPAARVWAMLSPQQQAALAATDSAPGALRTALVDALNAVLPQPRLHSPAHFQRTPLEERARRMLAAGVEGRPEQDVIRFNRGLLSAAFPDLIAKAPSYDLERAAAAIGIPGKAQTLKAVVEEAPDARPSPSVEPTPQERYTSATVRAFAAMLQQIQQARAIAGEPSDESAAEYVALAKQRDDQLAKLRDRDPSLYDAAADFLDHAMQPLAHRLTTISRARNLVQLRHTIAGRIGRALEAPLRPLGFDWRVGTALIGAFAAKEVFVAQLGIVFSLGEADQESEGLRTALQRNYSRLQGFCIMIFCLLSAPCMATMAITKRETNSWGWALFQFGGLTALGYVVTLIVYQVGLLLHLGV